VPVAWDEYDRFDWANARQSPMTAAERANVAELAADALDLAPTDRERPWGRASPPGRFAASVIHLLPGIPHRYQD
jgi:hypothetical protein